MPNLMRRQLPHTVQRHVHRRRGIRDHLCHVIESGHQRLTHQIILTQTQAAEVNIALDDLARTRILYRATVGIAARATMCPVNHVVAYVLSIRTCGQFAHLKRIDESGSVKGLIPPRGAFDQRRFYRLRCA